MASVSAPPDWSGLYLNNRTIISTWPVTLTLFKYTTYPTTMIGLRFAQHTTTITMIISTMVVTIIAASANQISEFPPLSKFDFVPVDDAFPVFESFSGVRRVSFDDGVVALPVVDVGAAVDFSRNTNTQNK